jgi:hypothetical protein
VSTRPKDPEEILEYVTTIKTPQGKPSTAPLNLSTACPKAEELT